jgi:intracellular sulfur oxidation DsrE/DsrF family protein
MVNRVREIVFFVLSMLFIFAGAASSQGNEALKGIKPVKAVFDIRNSNPEKTQRILKLIDQSFKDLAAAGKNPDFKLVFMGPSVTLFSTTREGFAPEDKPQLDGIVETISTLSGEGVGLEICRVALSSANVDPETVLPEITRVDNGWFSSIGYQAAGYALVPLY